MGTRRRRVVWRILAICLMGFAAASFASNIEGRTGRAQGREVIVAEVEGDIDRVSARFIERALESADRDGAELIIIRLDTPGGLFDSTRAIVRDILDSRVPVVVYVAPSGARAASAGTFIAAAAGVAAMAPATNIGAASPVGPGGEDLPKTLSSKAKEDAAALIRSIALSRKRNAEALEATVLEAKAYSAEEAVEKGVVDLIAVDLRDLLAQLNGRSISTANRDVVVDTESPSVRDLKPSFLERALGFLGNPNVAFLFFAAGGLLILIELWTPGTFGPAIAGIILLLLGFAGLAVLPFSWAGVALIVLAMALFFVESQVPGFGLFGIAGIVSLILGGVFLFGFFGTPSLPAPTVRVSPWTRVGVGGAAGLVVLWFVRELRTARKLPAYQSPHAAASLIGKTARVSKALEPQGEVSVAGEFWTARLPRGATASAGADVVVKGVDGLVLMVELPPAEGGQGRTVAEAGRR
jgi:membrane-bound serine protease (ClpP class)